MAGHRLFTLAPTTWRGPEPVSTDTYTFRNENAFLPPELRGGPDLAAYGNAFEEYRRAFATGIDGLFSDNPDTAVEARG